MAKYIDKDALVAEIKRRRKLVSDPILSGNDLMIGERNALFNLLSFIDTLEVKDVDLEKEFNNFLDNVEGTPRIWHSGEQLMWGLNIAKHFFELGIKLKQTSEDIKIGETQIYLNDDGGEPPYDGKQWLDLSCTEYEIPVDKFKDGDTVEIIIRKKKGE